jgi:hypothetical protein
MDSNSSVVKNLFCLITRERVETISDIFLVLKGTYIQAGVLIITEHFSL